MSSLNKHLAALEDVDTGPQAEAEFEEHEVEVYAEPEEVEGPSAEDLTATLDESDQVEFDDAAEAEVHDMQVERAAVQQMDAADIADLTAARADMQATIESLRNCATFVRHHKGVLSTESIELLQIGLAHSYGRLGLESEQMDVTDADAIEEHIESAEAGEKVLQESLESATLRASNEDVQIGDDEVGGPIPPEALAEAAVHTHLDQAEEAVAEEIPDIAGAVEALESIYLLAERQNAAGGFGIESLAALYCSMESITKPLGLESAELLTGVESVEAGVQYQVSLEAIRGKQIEADGVIKNIAKRYLSTWLRAQIPTFAVTIGIGLRLKMLLSKAQKTPRGNVKGMTVTVSGKNLHQNGSIPTNPAKYLLQYGEVSAYLVGKFHKSASTAFHSNLFLLDSVSGSNPEEVGEAFKAAARAWKDPRAGVPSSLIDFDAPGGRRLFADRPLEYHGSFPEFKKLDEFASLNYPTRVLWRKNDSYKAGDQWPALTVDEVVQIAKSYVNVAREADTLQHFIEQVAANNWIPMVAYVKLMRRIMASQWIPLTGHASSYKAERQVFRRAIRTSNHMRFHVGVDAAATFNSVAHSVIRYCKESLRVNEQTQNH